MDKQIGGDHYKKLNPQPIEIIVNWELKFIMGNVIKYIARYKFKNGIEDLRKAIQYLDFEKQAIEIKDGFYRPQFWDDPDNYDAPAYYFPAMWTQDVKSWELSKNIMKALNCIQKNDLEAAVSYINREISLIKESIL